MGQTISFSSYFELLIGFLQKINLFHMFSFFYLSLFVQFLFSGFSIRFCFFQLSFQITLIFFELNQLNNKKQESSLRIPLSHFDVHALFVPIQICLVQPSTLFAYRTLHYFHTMFDRHVESFVIHRVRVEEASHAQHS